MPILRCPNCYYATTIRQDSIGGVKCVKCQTNLFDYYYKDKTSLESEKLISEKSVEFKKKKSKADRDLKNQNEFMNNNQMNSYKNQSKNLSLPWKTTFLESFVEYALAIVILLMIFASFQYFSLRSGVQESTINMLNENGYKGYEADGITLPLSAAFGGITTAKVFLKDSEGNTEAIAVEVTQKGIPILSIFIGTEYLTEISGIELMQLR